MQSQACLNCAETYLIFCKYSESRAACQIYLNMSEEHPIFFKYISVLKVS